MVKESSRIQVLTELRSEQQALLSFGDSLDAKLNVLIGSGSLVLGLFSTLGLIQVGPWWYWSVVIFSAIVYFGVLSWLGLALAPAQYHFPLLADWSYLYSTCIPLEGDSLIDTLISQNIVAIEHNKAVNTRKAQAVKFGIWALLAILVTLSVCRLLLAMSLPVPQP